MLGMEPSPFQKFRDIIEFNYSPDEERKLDDEADEIFEGLDYQNSKRFVENHESTIFDWDDDEDWDFREPPEFLR